MVSSNNKSGPVVLVSRKIEYSFPNSYAYLSGYLIEQGEKIKILFRKDDLNQLINEILALNPLLVGFGNLYPELYEISQIIKLLRSKNIEFPVVIGGQMVSPTPEFAVNITDADIGVIGEGEIILYQLVQALRKGNDPITVKGLVVRNKESTILTGAGEFIMDMRNLPKIPYELFPKEKWLKIGRWYVKNCPQPHWRFADKVINIQGGRGCPFICNFCYHHSIPRYKPIKDIVTEAKNLLALFKANMIYFGDDLTITGPEKARELVDYIKVYKIKASFSLSLRFDVLNKINDELLWELKKSGCRIMGLGVESGSNRILKIIGKRITKEKMIIDLERLKNVGILPTVSIMVGQFTETKEDVEESIEFMLKTVRYNPNIQYAFTITTPFPGSRLYEYIFKKGLLKDNKEFYDKYFCSSSDWKQVVNLSNMSDDEVAYYFDKINKLYIAEKKKMLKKAVFKIEALQFWFGRIHSKIEILYEKRKRNILLMILSSVFGIIYIIFQILLEKINLKLRGIKL